MEAFEVSPTAASRFESYRSLEAAIEHAQLLLSSRPHARASLSPMSSVRQQASRIAVPCRAEREGHRNGENATG